MVVGDAGDILERMRGYHAVGIDKFIAIPMVETQTEMIEQTRLLDAEVIPAAQDSLLPVVQVHSE